MARATWRTVFAIDLIFERNSKAGQGASGDDPQVGQVIPAQTFLRAGHGLLESSVIQFGLQQGAEITVSIFDVMGRLVRNIEQGQLPAGIYTRSWNGRNNGGARVARGVYLIRLVAGEKVISQKVVLSK